MILASIGTATGKIDSNPSPHAVEPSITPLVSLHSNGSWDWMWNDGRCGEAGTRRRRQRGRQTICGPRPGGSTLRGAQRERARRCGPRTRASGVRDPPGASQPVCCSAGHFPPDARTVHHPSLAGHPKHSLRAAQSPLAGRSRHKALVLLCASMDFQPIASIGERNDRVFRHQQAHWLRIC